jgi:uncharacterized membrane protein YkgB
MFNIYEILGILFIHWFADFVLQTDKQAKGKSKNWTDLINHTYVYSMVWMIIGCILYLTNLINFNFPLFALITWITHTITDYFTSRLNSKLWEENKTHSFFVSIGFDQWLHYLQLFLTYYYLVKC